MEKLVQKPKTHRFPLIEKKLFGPILKKKENKKERVTESLHLMVKIARRSNYNMTLVSETNSHLKQNILQKPQSGSK